MMALMTTVRARNGESPYQSRRLARSIQPKRSTHDTIASCAALHQEIAVPLIGQGQRKRDPELFSADSSPPVHDSFDAAMSGKRRSASLVPRNFLRCSSVNVGRLRDLNLRKFDLAQLRACFL